MTKKHDVLELLSKKELGALNIAEQTSIKIDVILVYLSNLAKENKIEIVNDKKPYIYRAKIPLRYLVDLHSIMDKRMKFTEKPNEYEIEIIKTIEVMIK